MKYLAYFSFLLLLLAGCGDVPAGSPGSDTGNTGLMVTSGGDLGEKGPSSGFSVDTVRDWCDGDWEEFTSHLITSNFSVADVFDQYKNLPQGITFQRFTITYLSGVIGAPPLLSKTIYQTINVPLGGAASATATVELFGLETKYEFAKAISSGVYQPSQDPVSYTVHYKFYGNDWIRGDNITTQFTVSVEVGWFDNC